MKRAEETTEQGEAKFSARSKRSLLQQDDMQRKLAHLTFTIGNKEVKIDELQRHRDRWFEDSLKRSDGRITQRILVTDSELKVARAELAIFEEQSAELQARIAKLIPTPEQAQARAEQQELLAQLAAERLEIDRETEKAIETLRIVIGDRAAVTAKMMECAVALDFTLDDDHLGARRFDELAASLPADLAAASERWLSWFRGAREDAKPYPVNQERLVISETLAHHGVYLRGETVHLNDEEARTLLRADGAAQAPGGPAPKQSERKYYSSSLEAARATAEGRE